MGLFGEDEKRKKLQKLTIKQLRRLAKLSEVELRYNPWETVSEDPKGDPITNKRDMILCLSDSPNVTNVEIDIVTGQKGPRSVGRKYRTKAEQDRILKRQNYTCGMCPKDLSRTVPIFDHKKALALGGKDTIRNIWALCGTCDAEKTRVDRDLIAKRKRRRGN